jgi:putative SOS response-associated peptidase YedK
MPALARFFGLREPPDLQPRFNIAPTQPVATVLVLTAGRVLKLMRWGLVPSWAKDLSIGSRMINARAETVAQKPSFRTALRERRCIIVADGFYEWRHKGQPRQPYHIVTRDGKPMGFAGLWARWEPPEGGDPVESCTIITTAANELVADLHERMPVILDPKDYDAWLDPAAGDPQKLLPLLKQYPAREMIAYPVGTVVNSPSHESPQCLEPLPERGSGNGDQGLDRPQNQGPGTEEPSPSVRGAAFRRR